MDKRSSKVSEHALAGIPAQNIIFDNHLPHAEIMDLEKGMAWISVKPISHDDYDALELPEGMRKVGIGRGAFDVQYFRRPPNAASDGPLEQREIDGRLFVQNANKPLQRPQSLGEHGPLMIQAIKYQTLIYFAGKEVDVIQQQDGRDFIAVIASAPEGGSLFQTDQVPADSEQIKLPEGWTRRTEVIKEELVVHLPYPTEALFFPNGASYQGPVNVFADTH